MKIQKSCGYVVRHDLDDYRFITHLMADLLASTRIRGGRDGMRRKTEKAKQGTITVIEWADWFPKAQRMLGRES